MRRSSPSERRIFNLARLSPPVRTQGCVYQAYQVSKNVLVEEVGFYYKPLGCEDVAHLKVVWNLLVPAGEDCRTLKAKTASPNECYQGIALD